MPEAISHDKLAEYKSGAEPLPNTNRLWPLYGAGFEQFGLDGQPIERDLPQPGPDELLVRHDAVGICFSDVKVIRAGQSHPRIYRDMSRDPVVLGHEVALTVVAVGDNLRDQYSVGDRFIVQADIYVNGVGYAYGYELQGGFSQYNIVDQRVLNGDGGNYLLAIRPTTGYAEAALSEPWACVEASYHVEYRTRWKEGGTLLIAGGDEAIDLGAAAQWRPGRVVIESHDSALREQVHAWAKGAGMPVTEPDAGTGAPAQFDDILFVGSDPDGIESAFARLAKGGMINVVTQREVNRRVRLDVGRLHYDNLALVGATGPDISAAYAPIRTELKPGGTLWVLGAGGPMGQMHLQRALEIPHRPRKVVGTNLHVDRLAAVAKMLRTQAREAGIEFVTLSQESFGSNGSAEAALLKRLAAETGGRGFDDIAVMAPSARAIESAVGLLAGGGVMNIFAGLPRGTLASLDVNAVVHRGVRFTGMSGSSIGDLRMVRDLMESGRLSPDRSVVAIAGLEGVPEGLAGVAEGRFAGKVVIFPNLRKPLPLTTLDQLAERLPSVHARLEDGMWSAAAEEELLRLLL